MKKILFLTTFIVFNLGFSDLQSTIKNHYSNKTTDLTVVSKPRVVSKPQYEVIAGYKYLKNNNQKPTFFRRSLGYEKTIIGVNNKAFAYKRLKSDYCNAVKEIVKVDKGIVPGTNKPFTQATYIEVDDAYKEYLQQIAQIRQIVLLLTNGNDDILENESGCHYKGTYWNNANSQYKAKQFYNDEVDRYYKSNRQNNSSYFNLGIAYINQRKYREATKAFLEGAKNKDVDSMIALGTFSLAAKDFSSAKKYYKMAADLGNKEAIEIYNRLVLAGY